WKSAGDGGRMISEPDGHQQRRVRRLEDRPALLTVSSAGPAGRQTRQPASDKAASRTLQPLVALAVIAAAFLDPVEPAIGVVGLVGVVLVETGVHARLAGGLL